MPDPTAADAVLVLVTGTGRSGTSTMSGTLHHLGLHVPGPHLGANESNPKGFFESRWSVRFHNRICERAGISIADSRPEALGLVRAALQPGDGRRLAKFLADRTAGHDQTVVKDPRSVWVQDLWADVAAQQGLGIRFVSMLRHPAEVASSRVTYYSAHEADTPAAARARRRQTVTNVARWVNSSLVNERGTRGRPRAFVRYTDLLEDWRSELLRLQADLGLRYDVDVAAGGPCAVDDFIDAGLRRHATPWDGLGVPSDLRELAEEVWRQLGVLRDGHGADAAASARLDELSREYGDLVDAAGAVHVDRTKAAVRAARDDAAQQAQAPTGGVPIEDRRVHEVAARDLLGVAARRVARRLRG